MKAPSPRRKLERSSCLRVAPLIAALGLAACLEEHALSEPRPSAPDDPASDERSDRGLREALARGAEVDAIVLVNGQDTQSAVGANDALASTAGAATLASAGPYAAAQQAVVDALASADVDVLARYTQLPYLLLRVRDSQDLSLLARLPQVLHVYEDRQLTASLAESLPLVKQPDAQAQGFVGADTAVAVLDTGCDFTNAAFGACASAGATGCKVAFARDFAPDDGVRDANGHGTNVSAIVLGVAPRTKVLALDVFNGDSAASSSILAAIDWVVQNRSTYNIVAMNLSLGSGLYASACPDDVFAAAMGKARAAGVLPVVATGNNGSSSSVGSPACVPSVISVGAVHDANYGGIGFPAANCTDASTQADKVACFSNSASFMSLLAPGSRISAAGITASGTSQAAPHVAGAAAVVRAAFPSAPLNEIASRLIGNGPLIVDPRNGVSKHRLDVAAAVLGATAPDTSGPSASLSINGGASATRSASVKLTLVASDPSGVASMCVSNTAQCTTFVGYAGSLTWSLAGADGAKKVTAWFKDRLGNVSSASASVTLDTKKPTDGTLLASGADGRVSLTFSGFSDTSGALTYQLVYALDAAPTSCTSGTQLYLGSESSFVHRGLSNGKTYGYRLCALDAAGNSSAGRAVSARPAPEYDPPTGSFVINGGATFSASSSVTLTVSAADRSSVAGLCISTSTKCTSWNAFTSVASYQLSKTSGLVPVYLWLRDEWGNVSAAPLSASISVDNKAPTLGTFKATVGASSVRLEWTDALDSGSGLAGYRLVFAAGATAPASCQTGQLLSEGSDLAYVHSALARGTYSYRLCAKDRVGNWAAGKTLSATLR